MDKAGEEKARQFLNLLGNSNRSKLNDYFLASYVGRYLDQELVGSSFDPGKIQPDYNTDDDFVDFLDEIGISVENETRSALEEYMRNEAIRIYKALDSREKRDLLSARFSYNNWMNTLVEDGVKGAGIHNVEIAWIDMYKKGRFVSIEEQN